MYTTNCATETMWMTYADLRRDSDFLAEAVRKMEKIAFDNLEGFRDDPRFQKLKGECRAAVVKIAGLMSAMS